MGMSVGCCLPAVRQLGWAGDVLSRVRISSCAPKPAVQHVTPCSGYQSCRSGQFLCHMSLGPAPDRQAAHLFCSTPARPLWVSISMVASLNRVLTSCERVCSQALLGGLHMAGAHRHGLEPPNIHL